MQPHCSHRSEEADGRMDAAAEQIDAIRALVVRYCRARIGRRSCTYEAADKVAKSSYAAILAGTPLDDQLGLALLTFAYHVARDEVDDFHRTAGELPNPLSELPVRQREILVLRSLVGLSADDTALALGCSVNVVRLGQHRALSTLRPTPRN